MKIPFYKRKKFWKRLMLLCVGLPILLFSLLIAIVYFKQDALVQNQIKTVNKTFKGKISVSESHLAPFQHFPYVSIKIDDVSVYEDKTNKAQRLLSVKDIYVGFNIWDIITGNIKIKSILIEDGFFNIIQHADGTFNLLNALETENETSSNQDALVLNIEKIKLKNLDIHKLNEANGLDVETFVNYAEGGFKTDENKMKAHVDTQFELNVISNGDTTYIKHKHFELHTDVDFNTNNGILKFAPSGLVLENAAFDLSGSIATQDEFNLDLQLKGAKSNFDMLIAFAPEDLIPTLKRYENAGNIYFNASLKGKSTNGNIPLVKAQFGASDAYLKNVEKSKKLDEVGFKGYFTNGQKRDLSTTKFAIEDISAKLETGKFLASILVENFEEPDVKMSLNADFNLNFLAQFINLDVQQIDGTVKMDMKFHDIIDLDHPEKALQELNQSYYTELIVSKLNLSAESLPVPLKDLNVHLEMKGKQAIIDLFNFKLGQSDFSATGSLSDLPAIVHHTNIPVEAKLNLNSRFLNLTELTGYSQQDSTGVNEKIEYLKMDLRFVTSAKSITESKHLPLGEFYIDYLYAKMENYPHTLHDFHADIKVDEHDLSIIDFTGFIDDSDFHFNGLIYDYDFWMKEDLNGDIDLDISINSDLLRLEDVFSYNGENYVPEDYRHEEFEKLKIHLESAMHFKDSKLQSIDLTLDQLEAKMHAHPMRLEKFKGQIHIENDILTVNDFEGSVGKSQFRMDMNYYLGKDEAIRKKENALTLQAKYIDFDQLFNYDLDRGKSVKQLKAQAEKAKNKHEEVFNIYTLPFTNMRFDADIKEFIYHKIKLSNVKAALRTTKEHFVYVDQLYLNTAGGKMSMKGYFNGSNPEHIYLKPEIEVENIDLDALLFKFENFGQDELVSDNLKGRLTAKITGNIKVYPDLVPNINASEIHLDVAVLNGKLLKFEPIMLLSEYLGDRDLSTILFDTLKNHIDLYKGELVVPNMTIETSLGHFDISGKHSMNDEIEYYIRIPWKLLKQEAKNRIFGSDLSEQPIEIQEKDESKKIRYLNLKITGTTEDFRVSLGKDKRK